MRRALLLLATLVGLAVAVPAALAVTRNGLTPVAPQAGDSVPAGRSPVFRGRCGAPARSGSTSARRRAAAPPA